jgi:hypothetical protein
MAEGGIDDGFTTSLEDQNYRYELYLNWKNNINVCSTKLSVEDFCRNHCIPKQEFEEIVRTFDEDKDLKDGR